MFRVLIADDCPRQRTELHALITHWKPLAEIVMAGNGAEAVGFALSDHPNLILLDNKMPMMDGIIAAKVIRHHHKTHTIPLIGLADSQTDSALSAVCDTVLPKSLDQEAMMQALTHWAEKYQH